MNEKYIKQLYDFIGGKDAGFDYDAFKNDISTNEEYNKEIFDYAYGEQEGIDYNAYAFDTGLKKKEQPDSSSSPEPTPSSEATSTSESVGVAVNPSDYAYSWGESSLEPTNEITKDGVAVKRPEVTPKENQVDAQFEEFKKSLPTEYETTPPTGQYKLDGEAIGREELRTLLFDNKFIDKAQKGGYAIEVNSNENGERDVVMESLLNRQMQSESESSDKWDMFKADVYSIASGLEGGPNLAANVLEEITGYPFTKNPIAVKSLVGSMSLAKMAEDERKKTREYEQEFISNLADGNWSNAANQAMNTVTGSLPTSMIMMATGGGATTLGGIAAKSAATMIPLMTSREYADTQISPEISGKLTNSEQLLRSGLYGTFEWAGEVPSALIGMKSFNVMKAGLRSAVSKAESQFGKAAAEKVAADIAKKTWGQFYKELGVDAALGGAGEGFTQVGQMMTDDLMGVKDYTLYDYMYQGSNAAALGLVQSTVMQSPQITSKAVSDVKNLSKFGDLTPEDINQAVEDGLMSVKASEVVEAVSKTLPTDSDEKRANDANLIKEKEKLEAEIERVDKVISESSPQAKRIAKINEELSQESDQANDGASDQVTQETPVKEDIEKKYEDLTLDEKLELQDIAIDQMENEMAEQGIKEYELTNEMVDERASQILQQDIDNLERSLEGETRFSIAEEGESAFVADPADSEAITEEMNQMDEAEVNFTTPKGQTTSQVNPFEASNSSTNLNENEVTDLGFESQDDMVGGIEEFNGIPMITGVSDIAAGGTIKDSKGNDMNAKGGVMFNALAKVKAAWAGVKRETSQGQYDNAVKLYKKNKDLFDRLWDEGRLPKGHIPMAIIRMGNDAINSNELVFRYLAPEIKEQSTENQTAALNELVSDLKRRKGKFGNNPRLLQFIGDKNIKTLGGLMDAVVFDANARAKGDVNNTLTLNERAELFYNITSPEGVSTPNKTFLKALYKGTTDNSNVFASDNIYAAVGEPSMMKANKGDVVSVVGVDVLNGGVIDIDHPNYGSGPKGRLIKLIKNPTSGMEVFPEWKAKSNRVFKKDKAGKRPSDKNVSSQTMGTVANDKAFQGASVQADGITDMQQLAAKFRFAFPDVTVVETQQEFDAMLKESGVRTKVSKGKTILGMTKDGKVFLNPDQASLGTPIHEFGHIWIDFLRSKSSGIKGTRLLKRGLKLVEGTPELKAAIEKYGDNKLAREEALVELMATKGETIINAAKKSRFKEWMNAIFKYIKEKFTTLEGLKTKEIESMSLEDFINTGLADLFAGKAVDAKSKIKFDAAKESQGVMPRFSLGDDVAAFIKDARGQGISEVAIKTVLNRRGVSMPDIKAAFEKAGSKASQKSKVKPDVATTGVKDVVTPEILEQGKKEVTDVTKGTFSTANPVKIFKGIGGKKDLQGFRINAHKGAKGVFSSVDSELAATYGRDEGVAEVVIPKGTSIEVVEVDGTGMRMSDYRADEVKAINNSDAQIVKLITIDGVMKAGEKRQQQYVIKDDSLIEGLKKETPNEEVQAKPDVVDTKIEKEAPIEKEESPRLEIDLDESTKSWVPKKLNSALEGIRVGLQDRWYRLRKTIRLARKAGAVISDEIDAYTKRELQSGKVSEKVTKFKELIIKSKPNQKNALLEDMQEDGVTNLDEFGLFIYAQHAPERNQTLKDRAVEEGREDTEGLSGMTNEQAQEIIESMPKDKLAKYKEYAKRFREEVILPSIDELENSELINSELANTLRTKWKNYVPLMVEEFVSDKAKYPSPKFSVRGKDIYKAKGSNFYDNKSRVNPFISGIERYINYASRAEENRTFQSLVGLAEKINNPDILKVIRPKYESVRDTDGNTVYVRRKFENEAGKNLVEGKIDGKPVLIEVVNKNLFDALENSTISLNKVEQVLNAVNSYLRAVNTLMNPEFIVRNFVRDIQTAFINISAEDAKGMAAQMVKNVPSAIRGIIDNQRGNETEWSKIYQELKDEGGDVSWLEANDLTKIKKDIDASIKRYDKSSTKRNLIRALESIGGGWNTSMKATEMATRVAAYKTAIDKGYSKQKAASLAKNLTVNFEKKGVYGSLINSFYLFANAGIQGSAVIFKAMSKKGVGGNRARALAGSIIGMSFLNAMINDWVDDDDEVDKLTEVDKERNMIFMLPNKERVTIPLPYGYNLLWVTGQLSYDMASGNKTAGDAMASFLRAFDGAFNPLSSGNLGQMFTPTIAKPFVQAATNRNYKDAPIKPEDSPVSPKLKESSKFFKTARGSSKAVTDYLNKVSGGTEVVSGKVDISPEIIDHYIDFLGGGLGRFVTNSADIPYKIATGEDISTNNIPFARIFYRTPSSGRDLQVIYRTIEDSYKTKYNDRQKQKFFNSLNSALEEQVITVDEYEGFLDDFNRAEMIKSISESNPDLMLEDIKEILKD
jgi:hypothetical protein